MEINAHCRLAYPSWWKVHMKPRRMDGSPQKIMYVAKFESLSIYQAMKRCLVMGVIVELLPELARPK